MRNGSRKWDVILGSEVTENCMINEHDPLSNQFAKYRRYRPGSSARLPSRSGQTDRHPTNGHFFQVP